MTQVNLSRLELLYTGETAEALADTPTKAYMFRCYNKFLQGDFGAVSGTDRETNLLRILEGNGRVRAVYEAQGKLKEALVIACDLEAGTTDYLRNKVIFMLQSEEKEG